MNALTITTIDNEPRVRDIQLAEKLGMSRPRDIRANLIVPNLVELRGYGDLREMNANAGKVGRPALEYRLNEQQALLLCMFSRTEKAQAVRKEVIEVFTAYRRGQLQPVTPAIPTNFVEALRLAADEAEKRMIAEQKLQVAQEVIEEQLNHVTVDEWRALNHLNLSGSGRSCRPTLRYSAAHRLPRE